MTKDEALKLALEALQNPWKAGPDGVADAIIAIKEVLAQPEQKSVAMADYMALTEKYVALKSAVLTEREACAKIGDDHPSWSSRMYSATIRARG
jgi:hypothetical protein